LANASEAVPSFVDLVALLYHEARNVRHLKRAGHAELEKYSPLVNLAANRNDAWDQVQVLRCAARRCSSAREAEAVFEGRFQVGLEDLEALYAHSGWRGSAFGGNQWLNIARSVIKLREAIAKGDAREQEELLGQILNLRHNTGSVQSKLEKLDASLEGALGPGR
jgi:hypothetical protein